MNVLMIAYYFPPFGGGPVARIHGFVKYLPEAGIQPVVLTAQPRYYEESYYDDGLVDQYRDGVQIYQASMLFGNILHNVKGKISSASSREGSGASIISRIRPFYKMLLLPDEQILWVPYATRLGKQIINSHKIDAIFASAPPFSAHLVGAILSRQFSLPLFLDYRDLWSCNVFYSSGAIRQLISRLLERFTIATAKKLIVTNEAARAAQLETFGLMPNRIDLVENGFDAESIPSRDVAPRSQRPSRFRIRYVGGLTRDRNPNYFLKAVRCFRDEYPDVHMEISFVGFAASHHQDLLDSLGLSDMVYFVGSVPKAKALELMIDSEILLLLQRKVEGGETAIPGKLYEYLATGIPVLALDEGRGPTTMFLNQLGAGFVCEYTDVNAIVESLKSIVFNYEQALSYSGLVRNRIMSFDRRSQSKRLAETIRAYVS